MCYQYCFLLFQQPLLLHQCTLNNSVETIMNNIVRSTVSNNSKTLLNEGSTKEQNANELVAFAFNNTTQ